MADLRDLTTQRHSTWTDNKCNREPHNYSDDLENFKVVEGSFTNWKKENGEIYLSTWFIKA